MGSSESIDRDMVVERSMMEHRGLVVHIARKFRQRSGSFEAEEIDAAGMRGLAQAIERFDPALGVFASFAAKCIHSEIMHELTARADLKEHQRWLVRKERVDPGRLSVRQLQYAQRMKAVQRVGMEVAQDRHVCADSPATGIEREERREVMEALLMELPHTWRLVIRLLFFEGMSEEEAAAVLRRSRSRIGQIKDTALGYLRYLTARKGLTCESI